LLAAIWPIVTGLVTLAFGAADQYAESRPRLHAALSLLEAAGMNGPAVLRWLAARLPKGVAVMLFAFATRAIGVLGMVLLPLGAITAVEAGAASVEACGAQVGQAIQTAAGPVATAAVDGITCVVDAASVIGGAPDIAGLVTACSKFGVDAASVYTIVASLLKQHQAAVMADAGLPDVAAVLAPDPLTVHLVAILASQSSGK
ncbi:MAG: hypothetical protein KGK07_17315, partial [Chloroflexota bacterium]|nr:hypothetical protein [Chloroflexota bacterium]